MAAPNYDRKQFDLTTARNSPEEVIGQGLAYNAVTILAMPAGAGVNLHFGAGKQAVPQPGPGISWNVYGERDGCLVPADEGLFLTNPAGAGILDLLISYSGVVVSGGL